MKIKEFSKDTPKYEEVESTDEAEALVMTYPNSSKAWILYMVHYLKQAEVNKARVIALRALETINFREDTEKLNVWKALLNFENRYGSEESLQKALQGALQYQDQLKIYKHMMEVYIKTDKAEELEKLSQVVLKKFKTDKYVWMTLFSHYMQCGNSKVARSLYSRSLQCVPNKDHADLMGKLATLEFKHGEMERSLSMFEEILVRFPKRKDIRTIYIHILQSHGQEERAEMLLKLT